MRLKGSGSDISWDEILRYHTGWNLSVGDVAEDYRGVVNRVQSVIITRNVFYNALQAKHGSNSSSKNAYSSIAGEGYAVFDSFCRSLLNGFEAIENESEMEAFLSYVGSLGHGVPSSPSGLDVFLFRVWNPPTSVFRLPSYSAFSAAFGSSFRSSFR